MAHIIDPKILKLIDQIGSGKRAADERRACPRFPFQVTQRLAQMADGRLPRLNEFGVVECKNISLSGMAFLSNSAPAFDEAIVELGVAPDFNYLRVRVSGCVLTDLLLPEYVVRCQFNGRVKYRLAEVL